MNFILRLRDPSGPGPPSVLSLYCLNEIGSLTLLTSCKASLLETYAKPHTLHKLTDTLSTEVDCAAVACLKCVSLSDCKVARTAQTRITYRGLADELQLLV
jgi:hypothetical protein